VGKRKKPLLEKVLISDIGAEGKAIAKIEGRILFIPFGIPGDIVDVQVTSTRKRFYEGYITKYHKQSEKRQEPFCSHFKTCGGCKWQHLPYRDQLEFKQKQVIDHFERLGNIKDFDIQEILGSENTEYYRNKLEFTFSDNRWLTKEELNSGVTFEDRTALGFHIPKKFDKILDIEKCYLQKSPSNEIRLNIREFARKNNLSFFNIIKREGFLRNLIIRTSLLGEVMVIISLYYEDKEKREALLENIKDKFPQVTSLMYVINKKVNETLFDQDIKLYYGNDYILEDLDGLKFKIGPKSFYQTNSQQAVELYKSVKQMADLNKDDTVLDLYTGTGTIAIYLARFCKKVVGIEIIPEAIEDAKKNAIFNQIENTRFFAGDVKDVLNDKFLNKNKIPDVIIIDPPRAGLHPSAISTLEKIKSKKIIYVSCNSATQARDISMLYHLYKVDKIQTTDMFPHTHHVENIAKLSLR